MDTVYLVPGSWDLTVDIHGNIAMASNPYALAQDAASAIKLFAGEAWYDTTQGIPYWAQVLGLNPPLQLLKTYIVGAALTVPEVTGAQAFITGFTNRNIVGQVQITDKTGTVIAAAEI